MCRSLAEGTRRALRLIVVMYTRNRPPSGHGGTCGAQRTGSENLRRLPGFAKAGLSSRTQKYNPAATAIFTFTFRVHPQTIFGELVPSVAIAQPVRAGSHRAEGSGAGPRTSVSVIAQRTRVSADREALSLCLQWERGSPGARLCGGAIRWGNLEIHQALIGELVPRAERQRSRYERAATERR